MKCAISAISAALLTLSCAVAFASDDPRLLGGAYRDKMCIPSPNKECAFINIDFGADAKGIKLGVGSISGGDVGHNYRIDKTPIPMPNGYVLKLVITSDDGEQTGWIFLPNVQQLISADSGVVLSRP